MADAAELERLQNTLDYFSRYYEFDSAIKTHKENKEYLKTLIHEKSYVQNRFELHKKQKISMLIALGVAAAGALIAVLAAGISDFGAVNVLAGAVTGAVLFIGLFVGAKIYLGKQVEQKWAAQIEANNGITLQIEEVEKRCEALERQKRDYLPALDEKGLVVIPTKYIIEAERIASYVRDGKAETAKAAVELYEEEQRQLKERAIAERKRKEQEAAERARKLEEQREQRRLAKLREEEQREQAEQLEQIEQPEKPEKQKTVEQTDLPDLKKAAKKKTAPENAAENPAPVGIRAEPSAAASEEPSAPKHEPKLSMSGGKNASKLKSGLSMNSMKGNGSSAGQAQTGSIRLVDEPEQPELPLDSETEDIADRMNTILSMSKSGGKRKGSSGRPAQKTSYGETPAVEKAPAPQKAEKKSSQPKSDFGGLAMKKNGKK